MKIVIKKGKHRPGFWTWFRTRGIFCRKMERKVFFTLSCKYDLPGIEDDQDVNKLFGAAFYFPHSNSARFGWFFDNDLHKIVLMAYCYLGGIRIVEKIGECFLNKFYILKLFHQDGLYKLFLCDEKNNTISHLSIPSGHRKKYGFLLGSYFGGNNTAPHDIIYEMKNPATEKKPGKAYQSPKL